MPKIDLGHIELLVLITGLSGAGKSIAANTLSDLGFYLVENLPIPLFPSFLEFTKRSPVRFSRTALSLDIDSSEKQSLFRQMLHDCQREPGQIQIIFLDCKTEVIVKRYGQTRRPHPGFDPVKDQTLQDAISRESRRLAAIKEISNLVIDTSELTVHDLRREIRNFIESTAKESSGVMRVNFLSFGFKHGLPIDCDLVVDTRFLPNPYFVDHLRDLTGREQGVIDYVLKYPHTIEFIGKYIDLINFLLPHYRNDGKSYLNIGVGCTGGRHRSVVLSQELADRLAQIITDKDSYIISVKHRDVSRGND